MTTLKGRELDARIAEQIMGYRWFRFESNQGPFQQLLMPVECGGHEVAAKLPDILDWSDVPHFSTDISAAFQVVEKMREEGFTVTLEDGLDGTWECTFHGHKRTSRASGATLPEAICLAALEAKGTK